MSKNPTHQQLFNRYTAAQHFLESDHPPGTLLTVYGVNFCTSEVSSELRYIYENKHEAEEKAREPEGWYGGAGTVVTAHFVRAQDGRWGVWHEVMDCSDRQRALKENALAKLSHEERIALGLGG